MRVPLATYRLQFSPDFGFERADKIIDYLAELGISDIYASPIFKAKKGSPHGYDVTDPNELNPELGSREDFDNLMKNLKSHSMGWVQDIVPNHMVYDSENKLLYDVLEKGRDSDYADFFDIKWDYTDDEFDGKILAPFLGKPLREALEQGEIQLDCDGDKPCIRYYERKFPLQVSSDTSRPLDEILSQQFYRLAFWQETRKKINYRRFFYLNDFIALNADNEKVFDYTHRLILELVEKGKFTGLRIDHIDGLSNPAEYLQKLRDKTPDSYIVLEKILALDEQLPSTWPVQGTTGYDFMNFLNGIFCKQSAENQFSRFYDNISKYDKSFEELLKEKKKLIIEKYMAGELHYLLYLLKKITNKNNLFKEPQFKTFENALIEILAGFPVYRTYISGQTKNEFAEKFIAAFQQLSSALMAKGFEDTFLYNYFRFISLNEVGGVPSQFGITTERFHNFNEERLDKCPHTMNATATHDTKRGEDVRARLNVLSEMPQVWKIKVDNWIRINADKKRSVNGQDAPDKNDEYFLYQTLIGSFPFEQEKLGSFKQRIKNYMMKSVREAKRYSTWAEPNQEYESACANFVEAILIASGKFLEDFIPFQKKIAHYGVFNSLSQLLIKITSPGFPDFYQGSELWDLNLVDPDNRRPVDYERRKRILNEIKNSSDIVGEVLSTKEDGRIKMFLMWKALEVRKKFSDLFQKGDYQPLEAQGSFKNNVIAFARTYEKQFVITIAPRFFTEIISEDQLPMGEEMWKDTALVLNDKLSQEMKNIMTGKIVSLQKYIYLAQALEDFPVCLLCSAV
jgi:(1->4)-alpha-D-glucan 1-alpha-D-glucosylmutase